MHLRFSVLRGSKGRDVIGFPQPEHFQSPSNFGRSPGMEGCAPSMSAGGGGSLAMPASSGISGASAPPENSSGSGAGASAPDPPFFFFIKQSRQVRPASLRG